MLLYIGRNLTQPQISIKMKRITIVEDMPLYIVPLRGALEEQYEVSVVWRFSDGLNECVEQIKSQLPDIILLDHDLGAGFTGEDIIKHFPECRVISISSDTRKYCQEQFTGKSDLPRNSKELIELIGEA